MIITTDSGKSYSVATKAIDYPGLHRLLPLAECDIEAAPGEKVKVAYDFRGSYSGKPMPWVIAEGVIE